MEISGERQSGVSPYRAWIRSCYTILVAVLTHREMIFYYDGYSYRGNRKVS